MREPGFFIEGTIDRRATSMLGSNGCFVRYKMAGWGGLEIPGKGCQLSLGACSEQPKFDNQRVVVMAK